MLHSLEKKFQQKNIMSDFFIEEKTNVSFSRFPFLSFVESAKFKIYDIIIEMTGNQKVHFRFLSQFLTLVASFLNFMLPFETSVGIHSCFFFLICHNDIQSELKKETGKNRILRKTAVTKNGPKILSLQFLKIL